MRHEQRDPPAAAQRIRRGLERQLQRLDVLDAQEKRDGVERFAGNQPQGTKSGRVAEHEFAVIPVVPPSKGEKLRARIDARVVGAETRDGGRESSGAAAEIQDAFAGPWLQEIEQRRNRELAMMIAAVRTNPAGIPAGDRVPTAA
jgi:hypothetical protein